MPQTMMERSMDQKRLLTIHYLARLFCTSSPMKPGIRIIGRARSSSKDFSAFCIRIDVTIECGSGKM